jgi:hypothetical protein
MEDTDRIIGQIQATQQFMDQRIKDLEGKVDCLREFRWRLLATMTTVSVVCGVASSLATLFISSARH